MSCKEIKKSVRQQVETAERDTLHGQVVQGSFVRASIDHHVVGQRH